METVTPSSECWMPGTASITVQQNMTATTNRTSRTQEQIDRQGPPGMAAIEEKTESLATFPVYSEYEIYGVEYFC